MIFTKIVISSNEKILNLSKIKFNLEKNDIKEKFELYEWFIYLNDEKEKIIFIKYDKNNLELDNLFWYINDNYLYQKIIDIDNAHSFSNFELNSWDIIIPNTFISYKKDKKAFFIDYVVWENYDFKKFWLILNWICLSIWNKKIDEIEKIDEFYADIVDDYSYEFTEKYNSFEREEPFIFVKFIANENEDLEEYYVNALNILELII